MNKERQTTNLRGWAEYLKWVKEFKDEMYNKTGEYQKMYGFKIGTDPNHVTWNNEADAFKHAFAAAISSKRITIPLTVFFGNNHEIYGKQNHNQPGSEENMDKWNNRVGRTIWKETKKELGNNISKMSEQQIENYVAAKVMQKMRDGKLITSPSDTRKFKKSEFPKKFQEFFGKKRSNPTGYAAPVNDGRTFFTNEDIKKMSTDEFLQSESIIDNQILNKFAVTKQEALDGVINDLYTYVQGYVRKDGTKVSDYYRLRT